MKIGILALAAAICGAMPISMAAAQPAAIEAKAGKPWAHKPSGISLPAAIGPFVRAQIRDFSGTARIDIVTTYADEASGTEATVFIYRPAMPDTGLWFAVSSYTIDVANRFGTVTALAPPVAFPITARSGDIGLRQTYSITTLGRSTGIAMAALGPWIVKLRLTSRLLDPAQTDAAMLQILGQLDWPSKWPVAGPAAIVPDCDKVMEAGSRAEKTTKDGASILMGAMLMQAGDAADNKARKEGKPPERPKLCRDPVPLRGNLLLFQITSDEPGYVIPLGDAGTLLSVRRDGMAGLLQGKDGPPSYAVNLLGPQKAMQYPSYDRLPPPEQALEIIQRERPLSITTVDNKKFDITLDSASMK
ncbi:MAG: hypothetical protein JWR77_843 [Rhizorhabdus sp.]|nr:hypothetical protein [Rhizorhabdus sp.]